MFIRPNEEMEAIIDKLKNSEENEIYIAWPMYTNESIEKLKSIFLEVAKLNRNTNIIIGLNKVQEFELLDIPKYQNMGLDFKISLDFFTYTFEEFESLNNQLNGYLSVINDKMSPYEKYMALYNFARKFKEYRIIDKTPSLDLGQLINIKNQSCNLKYMLENDYMDCKGFSTLLQTLLNKAGIESDEFSLSVYDRDGSFIGGHARVIMNLNDDKYGIHGIFISDPTWDSGSKDDELEFSLLPFSSMREPFYQNCDFALLFDATNLDEFSANLIKLREKLKGQKVPETILKMICSIDRTESARLSKIEDETKFYLEVGNYVLSRSNRPIKELEGNYGSY